MTDKNIRLKSKNNTGGLDYLYPQTNSDIVMVNEKTLTSVLQSNDLKFQNVIDVTTDKDFSSAPEIITARKDKPNLNARLEDFEQSTTAQLAQTSAQLAETSQKLTGFYSVRGFKCDDGQYVQGDGSHDDTTGIQRALDTARGALYFPRGIYKITSGLTLSRNVDLIGLSRKDSIIRGDGLGVTEDVLTINFTDNFGSSDVRNWRFENFTVFANGGGRHALYIGDEGMQILSSTIENNSLTGYSPNGGESLYIDTNFAHGVISKNTFINITLKFYDANLVQKNLFFGDKNAITIDIINGVRNNVIKDNTIVNRDGHIHVINGDNIRIQNNQCEHNQSTQDSQNPKKTMIWLEGRNRPCLNTIISENNLGGGTRLDRLIYVDNAVKTVIEKNNLVAVNIAEIEITDKAINTIVKSDNHVISQISNPRDSKLRNAKIVDNGNGTIGVEKTPITFNSWVGGAYLKDENGVVHNIQPFSKGNSAEGTVILNLPKEFRPKLDSHILGYTDEGIATLLHEFNGRISCKNVPSNKELKLIEFAVDESPITSTHYTYFDNFESPDSTVLGMLLTGQTWNTVNNNLQIVNGEVKLISSATSTIDIAFADAGVSDCKVQCKFSHIPTEFAKSCRLVFRFVDINNYLYVTAWTGGEYQWGLYKVVDGVETLVWVGISIPYSSGDNVKVELNGDSVNIVVNDEVMTRQTISEHINATKHGISLYQTYGAIDNFGISM